MARLEIELIGINKDFKKVLKDSIKDVNAFGKALNFDDSGIKKVNTGLTKTKQLLKDISALSAQVKASLNNTVTNTGTANQLAQDKLALSASKVEAQNYRTEIAKLAAQQKALALATAQNRQQTVAAKGSYKEAQQTLTALGKAIREAEGGFKSSNPAIKAQIKDYRDLNDKLKAFDAQLGNHQRSVGNYQKALQGISSYLSAAFGFTALLAVGSKVIQSNKEISDSLSDVRRTAGLTSKEADELAKSLKGIDTRTGLKDLLGIATIGGQLGVSKNQLSGFTQAIDELSVALGGELQGGAEGIAKSLGVLDNIFNVTKSNAGDVNKAYNQIGSAILGLGQSGLATGDFLADFGERVGGIAKQAGLALPVILSYGAVLQENGVSAEVAGSSFKRLISTLAANSDKFFKVAQFADANLTLKQFSTIVNTDTKKALDLLFAGLNKGGQSTIAFNTILKQLKLSNSGVSQTVSALASNQEKLNGHIRDATRDFNEATIASEQFKIKNDNLAGSIDKLGNTFTNITTNPNSNLGRFFKLITDSINDALTALEKFDSQAQNDRVIIRRLQAGKSGVGFTGAGIQTKEDVKEAVKRYSEALKAAKVDRLVGSGTNKANDILRNVEGDPSALKKAIAAQQQLLSIRQKQANYSKAYAKNINNSDADIQGQIKKYQDLQPVIIQQAAVVDKLKQSYDALYGTQKRSNQEAPKGIIKDKKTSSSGGGKSTVDYGGKIDDVIQSAEFSSQISALDDLDKTQEKTRQKYQKLSDQLNDIEKAYTEKYKGNLAKRLDLDKKTGEALRAIEASRNSELADNRKAFEEKKADIIAGIEEKAGIVRETSRLKEQQQNDAYYNEQVRKYAGFADVIATLEAARLQQRNAINKQFDDDLIAKSDDLYSKIQDLESRAFIDNVSGSAVNAQKLKRELSDRINSLTDYYDKLRKLYKDDPNKIAVINAKQFQSVENVTGANNAASKPVLTQTQESIRGVIDSFGRDLANTLRNISSTADGTFAGIFSSLTGSLSNSLNDIFLNQFTKKLSESFSKTGEKLKLTLNDAVAGVGLAGSLISGVTKKSSTVGQGLGGALSGAAAGFTVAGPLGAAIGGGLGLLSGIFGAGKAKKEEQAQALQLAEQKKQTALLERANALAYASQIVGRQTVNGLVSAVDINEFGQVITKVMGNDLWIINERTAAARKRGK